MRPELSVYIGLFNILKTEMYAGQAMALLHRAGATDADLEVFARLDHRLQEYRAAQAKAR